MASASVPKTKGLKIIGKKWFIVMDAKICGYCQLGPFDDVKEAQQLRDCLVHFLEITRAFPIYQEDDLKNTQAHEFCKRFKVTGLVEMMKEKKLYAAYISFVAKGKSIANTPPTDKQYVVVTDEDEKEKDEKGILKERRSFVKEKESFVKEKVVAGAGKTHEDIVLVKALTKKLQEQVEIAERAILMAKDMGNTIFALLADE